MKGTQKITIGILGNEPKIITIKKRISLQGYLNKIKESIALRYPFGQFVMFPYDIYGIKNEKTMKQYKLRKYSIINDYKILIFTPIVYPGE